MFSMLAQNDKPSFPSEKDNFDAVFLQAKQVLFLQKL